MSITTSRRQCGQLSSSAVVRDWNPWTVEFSTFVGSLGVIIASNRRGAARSRVRGSLRTPSACRFPPVRGLNLLSGVPKVQSIPARSHRRELTPEGGSARGLDAVICVGRNAVCLNCVGFCQSGCAFDSRAAEVPVICCVASFAAYPFGRDFYLAGPPQA